LQRKFDLIQGCDKVVVVAVVAVVVVVVVDLFSRAFALALRSDHQMANARNVSFRISLR